MSADALLVAQQENVREDLVKLHRALDGENSTFVEVIAMDYDILVVYERNGGEAVESVPRTEYQWLYQYLCDDPKHADSIVKILNKETEDSDAELPFEWQIHAVELRA